MTDTKSTHQKKKAAIAAHRQAVIEQNRDTPRSARELRALERRVEDLRREMEEAKLEHDRARRST
jgi:hypothetical protein